MAFDTTPHPQVIEMQELLQDVRATAAGPYFVKKIPRLLPHPSSIDQNPARYKSYVAGADFDSYVKSTQTSLVGKMKIADTDITLPAKLEYMREDSDNDGLSLSGLLTSTTKNILVAGFHIWLADYQGLSDVQADNASIADLERLNPRATIKQYSRENVIDWDFCRINGAMQLTYILLREVSSKLNHNTGGREKITSYLKLGLEALTDEDSSNVTYAYYQQKIVESEGGNEEGEKNYVKINNVYLSFIPLEIVTDTEIQGGYMPKETGYLTEISTISLARYQVSAKYKEAMNGFVPTMMVYGMNETAWSTFVEVNKREFLAMGSAVPNLFDTNVKVEVIGAQGSLDVFTVFLATKEQEAVALGATRSGQIQVSKTATEIIVSAEQDSYVLEPLTSSMESSLETILAYCGMFQGDYAPDNLTQATNDISVDMNDDFAIATLSVEQQKAFMEMWQNGVISQRELLSLLQRGGVPLSDIEQILADTESSAPLV